MNISLYKTSGEVNLLNKQLSDEKVFSGTLRSETSIATPAVLFESEVNLTQYNYMYISSFGRYYYITDIISVRNGLWEVRGKVDVLMSFKNGIESSFVVLDHSEETGNTNYLQSNIWTALVKDKTDVLTFSNGFLDDGEYILITAGG